MDEPFKKLHPEKRAYIIEVAMKEFASYGYTDASTNRIVKAAGIGKGMLFYYFKTKEQLYLYLLDYGLTKMETGLLDQVDLSVTDFIERIHQIAKQKLILFQESPHLMDFLATFMLQADQQLNIPTDIRERFQQLMSDGHQKMYQQIDQSLFKAGIDAEKAMQLIEWSINGYQQMLTARLQAEDLTTLELSSYWDEFYQYLAVLKQAYYQE